MCSEVFGLTFCFDGSRLEFPLLVYPADLTLTKTKPQLGKTIGLSNVRCGVKYLNQWSVQFNILLWRIETWIIVTTSWQFVALKIRRPLKCKMCGEVFQSTFCFEGSRQELFLQLPDNLKLWRVMTQAFIIILLWCIKTWNVFTTSWQFQGMKVYRPFKCKMCGDVFESTVRFQG